MQGLKPPRFNAGDNIFGCVVLRYDGHGKLRDTEKSCKIHWYRVRCTCGEEFRTHQTRLLDALRRPSRYKATCSDCSNRSKGALNNPLVDGTQVWYVQTTWGYNPMDKLSEVMV